MNATTQRDCARWFARRGLAGRLGISTRADPEDMTLRKRAGQRFDRRIARLLGLAFSTGASATATASATTAPATARAITFNLAGNAGLAGLVVELGLGLLRLRVALLRNVADLRRGTVGTAARTAASATTPTTTAANAVLADFFAMLRVAAL